MARQANEDRKQFWRNLIERQLASGLSIARFCEQAGVSANSFFVWKRRLRPKNGQAQRGTRTSRRRAVTRARSNGPAAAATPLVPVRSSPIRIGLAHSTPRPLKSSGPMVPCCECRRSAMVASCATS